MKDIPPDFEIDARLRARQLVTHVVPNTQTEITGDDVAVTREDVRRGLPAQLEPGRRYDDVTVETRLRAQERSRRAGR